MSRGNAEKRTGTEQYAAFMQRLLRSYGKKAVEGELSLDALVQLRELRDLLDAQTASVVHALRSEAGGAHSWAEIGGPLGMDRKNAQRKFGSAETDARKVGGQPGHLR